MQPLDLLETARRLNKSTGGRPRQADLGRAVSTVYYALFHTICRNTADTMVGKTKQYRSRPAWRQAYRAVDHRRAKEACQKRKVMEKFPKEVEDFANLFGKMQKKRHEADYDPETNYTQSDVTEDIKAAEKAIKKLNEVAVSDRCAFAVWVTLNDRKG